MIALLVSGAAVGFFCSGRHPALSPGLRAVQPAVLRTAGVFLQQDEKYEEESFEGSYDGSYEGPASGYCREDGDDAPIDEGLVEELLAERNDLRREQDYEGADAVRTELNAMGVTVIDRRQIWFVRRRKRPEYTRKAGDDAEVDVERVEELVGERDSMRRVRNYAKADAIRAELSQMGVIVNDEDLVWECDPVAAAVDGQAYIGRGSRSYTRDPSCLAELDEDFVAKVEKLIDERQDLRRQRDYAAADATKAELWEMGVSVLDKHHMWYMSKAKGAPRLVNGQVVDVSKFGPIGHDYKRAAPRANAKLDDLEESLLTKINTLLGRRLEAKLARNFDEADALREQLFGLGVSINERTKEWSYTPTDLTARYGPLGHDYTRAEADEMEIEEETLATINKLLAQRLSAKFRREFHVADKLRDELQEMGVNIHDKSKVWRADGLSDRSFGGTSRSVLEYTRIEGDGDEGLGGDSDEGLISKMLSERAQARAVGNYGKSDELQARLRNAYNVAVDDRSATWWLALMPGGYYCVGPKPEPELQLQAQASPRHMAAPRHGGPTADCSMAPPRHGAPSL